MITQLIELLKFNIKAQHNQAYMDKTQRGKGIRVKGVLGWEVEKGGEKGGRKKPSSWWALEERKNTQKLK